MDTSSISDRDTALKGLNETTVEYSDPDIKTCTDRDKDVVSPCGGLIEDDHSSPPCEVLVIDKSGDTEDVSTKSKDK